MCGRKREEGKEREEIKRERKRERERREEDKDREEGGTEGQTEGEREGGREEKLYLIPDPNTILTDVKYFRIPTTMASAAPTVSGSQTVVFHGLHPCSSTHIHLTPQFPTPPGLTLEARMRPPHVSRWEAEAQDERGWWWMGDGEAQPGSVSRSAPCLTDQHHFHTIIT